MTSWNTCAIRGLQIAGTALIKEGTRLRHRGHVRKNALLRRPTKTRLTQVEKQIAQPDFGIATLIGANESTSRQRDILKSIHGPGQLRQPRS